MDEKLRITTAPLRDERCATSVCSDDPRARTSTSTESSTRRSKRATSHYEPRKCKKRDDEVQDENERLVSMVKRHARKLQNMVGEAESGRRTILNSMKADGRIVARNEHVKKICKVEMMELPNHHNPWLEPVEPSRSVTGDLVQEIDYVRHTFLPGRLIDTPCGLGRELPFVGKFPTYYAWSALPHNDFVEDEKELSDLPHGEELTDKFIKEYKKHFPHTAMEVEMRRTRNLLLTPDHIEDFIADINEEAQAFIENGHNSTRRNIDMKIFQAVSVAFNGIESPEGVMHRYYRSIGEPKHAFLHNLNTAGTGKTPAVSRFLDSCSRLLCNRCFRYDCLEHPYQTTRGPTVYCISTPNTSLSPCGTSCHQNIGREGDKPKTKPITLGEKAVLKTFLTEEEDAAYTYCQLATMINRPCRITYDDIRVLLREIDPEESSDNFQPSRSRPKSRQRDTKKKPKSQKEGDHKKQQYIPCNHEADLPCNDEDYCSCFHREHKCERFCACDEECRTRQFCRCTGFCQTKQCPCFIQRRECDPELCGCQAKLAKEGCCKNTAILFNSKKKVKCGASDVHGWGAFIMEPAKAGEFISEYTGEVISQEEAERRGRLYDQVTKVSYLFDLNLEFVVDAARKGNKIRYANHSTLSANCYPEIYRVQGENRIGIFAKRDLMPGEELFFDYSYTGDSLKFVQIEPSKLKDAPSDSGQDFRVACIAKNIESRPAKSKKKKLDEVIEVEPDGKISFVETSIAVRVLETEANVERDDEEGDKKLEIITGALKNADAMALQVFAGPKLLEEPTEVGQAYKKYFPSFDNPNESSALGDLWLTLSNIAQNAESAVGRMTVSGIPLDSSESSGSNSVSSSRNSSAGTVTINGHSRGLKREPR